MIRIRHARRVVAVLLALLLVCFTLPGLASGNMLGAKRKYVHLVLDDSGSMMGDGKWTAACYALQSLSAMLSAEDVLVLYRLNSFDTVRLTGLSGSERIAQINLFLPPMSDGKTPIAQVQQAAADLAAVPDTYDKWLVVVADGVFDGFKSKQAKLLNEFRSYKPGADTFRLAYMGIGSDVITIGKEDGDLVAEGIYPYYATDTHNNLTDNGIISKLNKIGNTIFTNYVLKNACTSTANGQLTLNLEMPMEQLIVIAQGVNLTLGDALHSAGGATVAGTIANPRFEELSGCIASFPSGGSGVPAGVYTLSYQAENFDPSQLMVYARPAVDIGVDLFSDGVALKPGGADLAEGRYTYEAYLIDPQTGNHIPQSEQTQDIYNTLTTTITNNDKQETGGSGGTLTAQRGTLNILSVALVPPSNARIEANQGHGISFRIVPEKPPTPVISLQQNGKAVSGKTITLDNDAQTADDQLSWSIAWEDAQTGQPASESLLRRTDYTVTVSNATQPQQTLKTSQGSLTAQRGTLRIAVQAQLDNGETSAAEAEWTVTATGGIQAGEAPVWKLSDLETNPDYSLSVVATIGDQPLTEEQWKTAELVIEQDGGLDWNIEPGTQVSTWVLRPRYQNGDMLSTATGDHSILVTARLADQSQYTAFTKARLPFTVLDLSQAERFKMLFDRYFIPVLILLIVLVIVIGYLPFVKNYFPRMSPVVQQASGRDPSAESPSLRLSWKSFLPYIPMSGTLDPNYSTDSISPTLHLKAGKQHVFYIRNAEDFVGLNNVTIDDERITEVPSRGLRVGLNSTIHMRSDTNYLAKYLFTFNGQS
ncbi:MAG: vWA domain-containing protein [Candidatus Limiplasma sp.]|nr:vWA domain-containing protein [Candidatus Limiplasma sp.]